MKAFRPGLKHPFGFKPKCGHIYFIRAGENGPIKIGFSTDPEQRLRTLQTAHTEKLVMLHSQVGTKADEARLHNRFRNIHVKGEWFEADPSLLEFIHKRKSP